jgi:hypothetical protein
VTTTASVPFPVAIITTIYSSSMTMITNAINSSPTTINAPMLSPLTTTAIKYFSCYIYMCTSNISWLINAVYVAQIRNINLIFDWSNEFLFMHQNFSRNKSNKMLKLFSV